MVINLPRREACVNVRVCSAWRKQIAHEIPVPRIGSLAGARILQRFELEPVGGEPDGAAVVQQALSIGGD